MLYFCLQMVLVVIFIIAVIMYRVLIAIPLFQNEWTRSQASIIASLTSACVNLVLIMALSLVYEKLAFRLTQWGKFILTLYLSWLSPSMRNFAVVTVSVVLRQWWVNNTCLCYVVSGVDRTSLEARVSVID